jgi:hypothetical protein
MARPGTRNNQDWLCREQVAHKYLLLRPGRSHRRAWYAPGSRTTRHTGTSSMENAPRKLCRVSWVRLPIHVRRADAAHDRRGYHRKLFRRFPREPATVLSESGLFHKYGIDRSRIRLTIPKPQIHMAHPEHAPSEGHAERRELGPSSRYRRPGNFAYVTGPVAVLGPHRVHVRLDPPARPVRARVRAQCSG